MSNSKTELKALVQIHAEKIYQETGKMPTNQEVRNAIGSGSFSTIAEELADWKQGKERRQVLASSIPIPSKAKILSDRTLEEIWALSIEAARGLFDTEKISYRLEIDSLISDIDYFKTSIKELENRLRVLAQENENLKMALKVIEKQNSSATQN